MTGIYEAGGVPHPGGSGYRDRDEGTGGNLGDVIVAAIAGEELIAGNFVRLEDGYAFLDPTLTAIGGVARSPDRNVVRLERGDPLEVRTDGGARAVLTADVSIQVRGVEAKLVASAAYYLHLRAGRVIGFLNDWRLAHG